MNSIPISANNTQQAIDAALDQRWKEALTINKKIIKLDPQNVDALNRQARAFMELGKTNLAKKYYSQALKYDPYNPIAQKNLKIMRSFKSNGQISSWNCKDRLSPSLFLQEPGKTKMVNLLNVAEPQKLSQAYCGMKVTMATKNRRVSIIDTNGNYLGVLPDDISHHLFRLTKGGNKYELFIKSISVNSLSVLIKETFRSKRFRNQSSFLEYSPSSNATSIIAPLDRMGNEEGTEEPEEEQNL